VWPERAYLPSYAVALERGWSPRQRSRDESGSGRTPADGFSRASSIGPACRSSDGPSRLSRPTYRRPQPRGAPAIAVWSSSGILDPMPSPAPLPRVHPLLRRRQRRLRTAGALVLATGIAIAMVNYRIDKRDASPTVEELLPGTTAVIQRQRGLLYGEHVAEGLAWLDYFKQPEGRAVLIVVVTALSAGACFYAAFRLDDPR
jgi:hypothetical protein